MPKGAVAHPVFQLKAQKVVQMHVSQGTRVRVHFDDKYAAIEGGKGGCVPRGAAVHPGEKHNMRSFRQVHPDFCSCSGSSWCHVHNKKTGR